MTLVCVGVFFRQEKLEKMAEKFERKVCHCVQRRNPTAVAHWLRFYTNVTLLSTLMLVFAVTALCTLVSNHCRIPPV